VSPARPPLAIGSCFLDAPRAYELILTFCVCSARIFAYVYDAFEWFNYGQHPPDTVCAVIEKS